MNILLIGNGFDLAHGLPTKYTDFLIFCKMILKATEISKVNKLDFKNKERCEKWINNSNIMLFTGCIDAYDALYNSADEMLESNEDKEKYHSMIKDCLNNGFYGSTSIKEMSYLVYDNFWIKYFKDNPTYQKENWIDFESEISKVIRSLDDSDMRTLSGERFSIDDKVNGLSNKALRERYSKYIEAVHVVNPVITNEDSTKGITFKQIRNDLLRDLNRLVRAFEIYLTEYVEKIDVKEISPDIELFEINYVISFNYTNTYSKIYRNPCVDYSDTEKWLDYIHGKANIKNTVDSNNMVLGIDEYLPDDRKNKDVEFIAFKKYYQRIHKETGCKYKKWINEIIQEYNEHNRLVQRQESYIGEYKEFGNERHEAEEILKKLGKNSPEHFLYIFGHSLDVTDKDILNELILTEGMHTTIYYRNMDQKGQQIANLVKVIGQDELIKRTGGGSAGTIKFKQQKPMIKRGEGWV